MTIRSVHIDQVLVGGDMPYRAITVDVFPSHTTALRAFDAASAEHRAALSDIYALAVRPAARLPRIAKTLRFFAPLLRRLLGTMSEGEIPRFDE